MHGIQVDLIPRDYLEKNGGNLEIVHENIISDIKLGKVT